MANVFSEISSSASFVVLASIISRVDITSLPDEDLQPSCSPEHDADNATIQRVFEGIQTTFEALVDVSSNDVVFDWLFVDSSGVVVFNVSQNGSACLDGKLCTVGMQVSSSCAWLFIQVRSSYARMFIHISSSCARMFIQVSSSCARMFIQVRSSCVRMFIHLSRSSCARMFIHI